MSTLIRLPSGWINLDRVERIGRVDESTLAVHFQSGQVKNCSGEDADRLREALDDFDTDYRDPEATEDDSDGDRILGSSEVDVRGQSE